jgi:steroid delta-isomerase-like uncharacterized protein
MSTRENKALVRRYAEEVWNKGNLDVLDEYVAPEIMCSRGNGHKPIRGPEGLKKCVAMIRTAFPDHCLTIEETIAEGDKVVWRWTMRGTYLGSTMGVLPTGNLVTTGIAIYRLQGGKIVERRGEADMLGLLEQLGVIPKWSQADS